ncbi:hypothetical protein CPter91_5021 [Collimonas pratensis]|uniref:Uncharacterized protein n=1 Tax=Collimonas pratensis TaxID=279113 RepID=A0A127QB70_9BURK|nr:hypothetical protein CPter91_5021 [Collimonas pratensis]
MINTLNFVFTKFSQNMHLLHNNQPASWDPCLATVLKSLPGKTRME